MFKEDLITLVQFLITLIMTIGVAMQLIVPAIICACLGLIIGTTALFSDCYHHVRKKKYLLKKIKVVCF